MRVLRYRHPRSILKQTVTVIILSGIFASSYICPAAFAYSFFRTSPRKSFQPRTGNYTNKRYGAGEYEFSLYHNEVKRIYKVHVPARYRRNIPTPLVLAFHGGGGNAQGAIDYFQLNGKADAENFIVVYPQGTGKKMMGKVFGSWNAGRCCPPATSKGVDDVGFIREMLDDLSGKFSVDPNRIFATGFSNGALISYRLACELSDRIAAIAVGGAHDALEGCRPRRPVPILHFHGTQDKCGLYEGGMCGGCFADYLNSLGLPADRNASLWQCRPVTQYMEEWSRLNGCSGKKKVVYQKGSATCVSYGHCKENAEVVLCTLEGSGHTWPGGNYGNKICDRSPDSFACREWKKGVGEVNRDFSANDALWDFFKTHPKK